MTARLPANVRSLIRDAAEIRAGIRAPGLWKLVSITRAGEKVLAGLYRLLYKPTLLMYSGIDLKDKQVVINILKDTEHRHQEILSGSRNLSLDELLTEQPGEEYLQHTEKEQKKRITEFKQVKRKGK